MKNKKPKVPRTRNGGTMTEQAFWSWIYYALRKRSMFWKPIANVKNAARRPSQSDNKKLKWEYQCIGCKSWFPGTQIVVDHIHGTGGLTCKEQLPEFVERLFCEENGLRVLCKDCHVTGDVTILKQEDEQSTN